MMQILMVVMAIGLASLLVVGGINYMNADLGTRIKVTQGLMTQYESLNSGISSYRSANGGMAPGTVGRLSAYLVGGEVPRSPVGTETLAWEMSKLDDGNRVLCLTGNTAELDSAVTSAVAAFVDEAARRDGERAVAVGADCKSGSVVNGSGTSTTLPSGAFAVTFRGN
jgi:hypothetical protein